MSSFGKSHHFFEFLIFCFYKKHKKSTEAPLGESDKITQKRENTKTREFEKGAQLCRLFRDLAMGRSV